MPQLRLTARKVQTLTAPGRYGDGGNLYLKIGPSGGKSFVFRYMLNGASNDMGLGPVDLVSLAEARELAHTYRRALHDGNDPIAVRKAAKGTSPSIPTFKTFAEKWIDDNGERWRNAKGAPQWRHSLRTYAYPTIGDLPLNQIATGHIVDVLKPIWSTKPETADKLRSRMNQILDAAKSLGYRTGDNPCSWRGNLKGLLPAHRKATKHYAAINFAKVPAFIKALRKQIGIVAPKAFEFLILTMTRTSETTGARWEEFDLRAKAWTIPAERTKANREHRVPLSAGAMTILKGMPREGDYVFPGQVPGRPLSNMAFLQMLKRMEKTDITPHGFRSAARTWAGERTQHQREVAEQALGHVVGNEVERTYNRGTMYEKRAALMADWAAFCTR